MGQMGCMHLQTCTYIHTLAITHFITLVPGPCFEVEPVKSQPVGLVCLNNTEEDCIQNIRKWRISKGLRFCETESCRYSSPITIIVVAIYILCLRYFLGDIH